MKPSPRRGARSPGRAGLLALGLASGLSACGETGAGRARSALLVTLDTTRADALSCYGNPERTTPALDALAAEGVVFDAAHTVAPLTLPAHASMLTGLYPLRHGLRDNGETVLAEAASTLAERARAGGLDTATFVGSAVLDEGFGLGQGFAVYSAPVRHGRAREARDAERPARATVDAALAWLAERPSGAEARPFFLWVHLHDAHAPYAPPADLAGRFSTPYLGEVAAADRELGRLLGELSARGLSERLFVLVLGDHGEAFGEHGESAHGLLCYETTLRIPLVARWPDGSRAGTRSQELVSAVDVAPTVAEALGLAPLEGIDGLSFFARELPAERGVYLESCYGFLSRGWSPIAGWLDARGKYLHSSRPEFYDWRIDPLEREDRLRERGGELQRYRDGIARLAALPALASSHGELDGPALEALGYARSGPSALVPPDPLAPCTLPDPRSELEAGAR